MKPSMEELLDAVESMACIIPFFPKERKSRALVAQMIGSFVNTPEELEWLVLTACGSFRDWDKAGGVVELRGLFCTRYRPADGITANCTTPGLKTEEAELRYLIREMEENRQRFGAYQRAALAAPEEMRKPVVLPELKKIPRLKKTIQ